MESNKRYLIEGEVVNIKRGFDGWRVYYPIKNDDGSINWFNLITGGNIFNLVWVVIVVLVICLFFYEYWSNLNFCNEFIKNYNMMNTFNQSINNNSLNISYFELP